MLVLGLEPRLWNPSRGRVSEPGLPPAQAHASTRQFLPPQPKPCQPKSADLDSSLWLRFFITAYTYLLFTILHPAITSLNVCSHPCVCKVLVLKGAVRQILIWLIQLPLCRGSSEAFLRTLLPCYIREFHSPYKIYYFPCKYSPKSA